MKPFQVILDEHDRGHAPDDWVKGRVIVALPAHQTIPLSALSIVWAGTVTTAKDGLSDQYTYFKEVWRIDERVLRLCKTAKNQDNHKTYLPAFVMERLVSNITNNNPVILEGGKIYEFMFELLVPSRIKVPKNLKITDNSKSVEIEYAIESFLNSGQTPLHDKAPVSIVDEMDKTPERSVTAESVYDVWPSENNMLASEAPHFKAAVRLKLDTNRYVSGSAIEFMLQFWYSAACRFQNGIQVSLIRRVKMRCKQETVEFAEATINTTFIHLDVIQMGGYYGQTISDQLAIPADITQSVTMDKATLVSVDYQLRVRVCTTAGAVYINRQTKNKSYHAHVEAPIVIYSAPKSSIPKMLGMPAFPTNDDAVSAVPQPGTAPIPPATESIGRKGTIAKSLMPSFLRSTTKMELPPVGKKKLFRLFPSLKSRRKSDVPATPPAHSDPPNHTSPSNPSLTLSSVPSTNNLHRVPEESIITATIIPLKQNTEPTRQNTLSSPTPSIHHAPQSLVGEIVVDTPKEKQPKPNGSPPPIHSPSSAHNNVSQNRPEDLLSRLSEPSLGSVTNTWTHEMLPDSDDETNTNKPDEVPDMTPSPPSTQQQQQQQPSPQQPPPQQLPPQQPPPHQLPPPPPSAATGPPLIKYNKPDQITDNSSIDESFDNEPISVIYRWETAVAQAQKNQQKIQ